MKRVIVSVISLIIIIGLIFVISRKTFDSVDLYAVRLSNNLGQKLCYCSNN